MPFLALLLASLACASTANIFSPIEKGEIIITSDKLEYHDDEGIAQVVVHSTFENEKIAGVSLNGSQVFICTLTANANTTCPSVQLPKPGTHTISVITYRVNGDPVSAQTTANWAPYTAMDKVAQKLAGGEGKDPAMGYAFGAIILVVVFTIAMTVITKGHPVGAISGFFISIIIVMLVLFQADSTGPALVVFNGMIGLAVAGVVATVLIMAIKNGYTVTSPKADISLFHPDGRIERGSFAQPFFGPVSGAPSFTEATRAFAERNDPRLSDSQRDTHLLDDGF